MHAPMVAKVAFDSRPAILGRDCLNQAVLRSPRGLGGLNKFERTCRIFAGAVVRGQRLPWVLGKSGTIVWNTGQNSLRPFPISRRHPARKFTTLSSTLSDVENFIGCSRLQHAPGGPADAVFALR